MPQLFSRAADAWMRTALVAIVGLPVVIIGVLMALVRSPYITGQHVRIQQPVPFSHQHHVADAGIDCRYCHTGVEVSPTAGLPSTEICMNCHRTLWKDAPTLSLVRSSWRDQQPLKWNRVHDLPDFAYFNHSVHVHKGIGCYSCHGRIGEMPLVSQAKPLTMKWCLDCHRSPTQHVRPRDLVFEPKPLNELTHRVEYREAVAKTSAPKTADRKASGRDNQPETDNQPGADQQEESDNQEEAAERSSDASSKSSSRSHRKRFSPPPKAITRDVSGQRIMRLRSELAEQYDVQRRTNCYTCHR